MARLGMGRGEGRRGESGLTAGMTLYLKCPTYHPNVGDVIAEPIARHYFRGDITVLRRDQTNPKSDWKLFKFDKKNLLFIGSIAEWSDPESHLCGVGLLEPGNILRFKPKKVHAVRGPLTRFFLKRQGIEVPDIFGDPGVLLPQVMPMPDTEPEFEYGIVPHYLDKNLSVTKHFITKGAHLIDVFQPPQKFVQEILRCKVIFSSSLHGLVLAHAYGRPALWISLSNSLRGGAFKFNDYYLSLGVSPELIPHARITGHEDPVQLAAKATLHDVTPLQDAILPVLQELKGIFQ